jgi:hypothetical protein
MPDRRSAGAMASRQIARLLMASPFEGLSRAISMTLHFLPIPRRCSRSCAQIRSRGIISRSSA